MFAYLKVRTAEPFIALGFLQFHFYITEGLPVSSILGTAKSSLITPNMDLS
jgi:hypothetical protein